MLKCPKKNICLSHGIRKKRENNANPAFIVLGKKREGADVRPGGLLAIASCENTAAGALATRAIHSGPVAYNIAQRISQAAADCGAAEFAYCGGGKVSENAKAAIGERKGVQARGGR
jgi:hypothetical protein